MKKVFINGCFDVLHYGHFKFINYAVSLGCLVIGIDSDRRIKLSKGSSRPFHNQNQRKFNLSCIKGVNKVCIFNTDDELRSLIKKEDPDIMVIGCEYKNKQIIGKELFRKILYFPKVKKISTTRILNYEDTCNR